MGDQSKAFDHFLKQKNRKWAANMGKTIYQSKHHGKKRK